MRKELINTFRNYDYSFFGISIAIFTLGVLNLYSATHTQTAFGLASIYKTQILYFTFALGVGLAVSFFDPKALMRYSYGLYAINILLLILVFVLGEKGMGARRWLVMGPIRIQPSELMKLTLVLALARWYSNHRPESELGLRDILMPSLITFLPAGLVIAQPDLGTGLVLILIFLVITFYKRLKWKSIFVVGIVGVLGATLAYNFGLREYQRQRIRTFLDPYKDAKGSGYNAIQSEIAIGSGRLFGKGFKKSTQASLSFLPENHTDFVFSIFNEEHGFFGSFVLISFYMILLMRLMWLANSCLRFYDSILCVGVTSIFFWHTFINMSMVMGLMPIVGLPLPFMSYGGSSLVTFGLALGVVASVSNSRRLF